MAYTPPDGDNLQFDFTSSGYVPPDGDNLAIEMAGAASIEGTFSDAAALNDSFAALVLSATIADAVGISDAIDGYYLRGEIADGLALGSEFIGQIDAEEGELDEDAALNDALLGTAEIESLVADSIALSAAIDGYYLRGEIDDDAALDDSLEQLTEYHLAESDQAALSDSFSCLNWSDWLRQNSGQTVKRFYFTLTGDGETPAVADAVIPITSFQGRMRQGEPTYLSVVLGDVDSYAATINARSHGQMVIDMALLIDGVEAIREEIIRVDLEDIRIDEGPRNKSISLSGHATVSYTPKITALSGATYKSITNGMRRYRCDMDPYLRPGDTVRINGEEFEIASLSIFRSVGSEQMEIVEAES